MNNPFKAGLPRQEAKRQAIEDSIETNRRTDLNESDYNQIYDLLLYSDGYQEVNKMFRVLGLNRSEWNLNPELDNIRKGVLRQYLSEFYNIESIRALLDFTDFVPDWADYKEDIGRRYLETISNYSIDTLLGEQEYFGIPVDWNDPNIIDAVITEYKKDLKNRDYDHLKELARLSNIKFDWQGNLKSDVEDALRKAIDGINYDSDAYNDLLNLIEGLSGTKFDQQREFKSIVSVKYKELLNDDDYYWLDNFITLQQMSGIEPDWQGELKPAVMERYGRILEYGSLGYIAKLQEVSGVEPDWQGELKPVVMGKYLECLTNGQLESITKLQEVSGVEPDWQGELKPVVMEGYGECVINGYLESITKLQKMSGVIPDWQGELKPVVMGKYVECLTNGQLESVTELQKLSGVLPDWQGELKKVVMNKYGEYIKHGFLESITKLQEMSGLLPDWQGELKKVVMNKYGEYIKKGYLEDITKLQEMSGLLPDWQGELKPVVMEGYGRVLKDRYYGYLESITKLQKVSGVEPDWQGELKPVVMEGYGECVKKCHLNSITALQKMSGVLPDWHGELKPVVMEGYEEYVKNDYLDHITKLQKMSGVIPDWHGELNKVVMKKYGEYIKKGRLNSITELKEMSGVLPDWQGELKPVVMEKYGAYIKSTFFEKMPELERISGVQPDWQGELKKVVLDLYGEFITKGYLHEIISVQKISGVVPDWERDLKAVVLSKYHYYIGNGNFDDISALEDLSKIRIDWKDKSFGKGVRDFYEKALASGSLEQIQRVLQGIKKTEIGIKEEKIWRNIVHEYFFGKAKFKIEVLREVLGEGYDEVEELIKKSYGALINRLDENFSGLDFEYLRLNPSSSFNKFGYLLETLRFRPSDEVIRLLAYASLSPDGNFSADAAVYLEKVQIDMELRHEELNHIAQQNFNPSHLAFILINYMPKRKDKKARVNEAIEQIPVFSMVQELLEIRGLAVRKEYCPWRNGFDSLFKRVKKEQGDWSDKALCDGLLEYAKRFGMVNLPVMCSIVIDLISNKFDENKKLRTETVQKLTYFWQAHGIDRKIEDLDNPEIIDAVLNELNEAVSELREIILRDEIPEGLEHSDIDMELFNILIPRVGSYGNLDDRRQLIAKWRATVLRGEVQTAVPEYLRYDEVKSADVGSWGRSSLLETGFQEGDDGSGGLIKDIEAKKLDLLENNPLEEMLLPLHEAMRDLKQMEGSVLSPDLFFGGLINDLQHDQRKIMDQINETDESQTKKIAGLKKKLEKTEGLLQKLQRLITDKGVTGFLSEQASLLDDQNKEKSEYLRGLLKKLESGETDGYLQMQAMLEVLIGLYGQNALKEARKQLYTGIVYLMKLESGGHYDGVMEALADSKRGVLKEEQVTAWVSWYKDELLEHFLNPAQAHDIRYVPFSVDLMKLAEKVLYATNIKDEMRVLLNEGGKEHKNPLVATWSKLRVYNEKLQNIKEGIIPDDLLSKERVFFCPAHGLTRIFGGDIANACYDKQRYDLAEGKKPRINTINLVIESDGKLEILGNCLLIETTNKNDERVLVTRAFNPSEKAIQRRLDPKDLLRKMIDFVIEAAKKGGFDAVNVCVGDHSGADGTNRKALFDIMAKEAVLKKWEIAAELKDEPETNFNNYATWDTQSHKVYCVWQREK